LNSERGQTVSMPGNRRVSSGAYDDISFSDIEKLVVGAVTKELIEEEEGAGFGGSKNSEHGKRMTVALQAAREDTSKFENPQYHGYARSFFQTILIGSRRNKAPRLTSKALWTVVTGLEDDFVPLLWASTFRNHVHFQTTLDRYPAVVALLRQDYSVDTASVTPDVFGGAFHVRKLNLQRKAREILRQTSNYEIMCWSLCHRDINHADDAHTKTALNASKVARDIWHVPATSKSSSIMKEKQHTYGGLLGFFSMIHVSNRRLVHMRCGFS